jgi:hypothetical protein
VLTNGWYRRGRWWRELGRKRRVLSLELKEGLLAHSARQERLHLDMCFTGR